MLGCKPTPELCADPESFDREDPTFFYKYILMRGGRIQIPLLVGLHRPASETPFKWGFTGAPMMPNVECWLGNFVIFKGIRSSFAKSHHKTIVLGVISMCFRDSFLQVNVQNGDIFLGCKNFK